MRERSKTPNNDHDVAATTLRQIGKVIYEQSTVRDLDGTIQMVRLERREEVQEFMDQLLNPMESTGRGPAAPLGNPVQ